MSEKKRRAPRFWCAAVLMAVFVIYPLSIGPAMWLFVNVLPSSSFQTITIFYIPLRTAARIGPVNSVLTSYVHLWIDGNAVDKKLRQPS